MAAAFLRRSAATAGLAVVATMASPLAGIAFAAGTALTAGTFSPANATTAPANRPAISVAYNTALSQAATKIGVVDTSSSNAVVPCSKTFSNASATVGCSLGADLKDGHAYKVSVHAVSADGTSARDDSATWTDDIPSVTSSVPSFEGSVYKADVSNPLSVTFDEAIFPNTGGVKHSTLTIFDGNGDAPNGTLSFSASSLIGKTDTISFKPSNPLSDGHYTAALHVDGVGSGGADNPAAFVDRTYGFWVTHGAPAVTSHSTYITSRNQSGLDFAGTAAPGLTIDVSIPDSSDPSGASDGAGSTTVAPCSAAPVCPWAAKVDASGLHGDKSYTWYVTGTDGNDNHSTATSDTMIRDTTAPNAPTVTAPSPPVGSSTLHVSATDSSADVATYHVSITDTAGSPAIEHDYNANNLNLPDTAIDVSSLGDGTLSVVVSAVDYAGNAKAASAVKPVKDVGISEDFANSSLQIDGQPVPFQTATQHPVRKPSQVTIKFTQPVVTQWTDSTLATRAAHGGNAQTYAAGECVVRQAPGSSCVSTNLEPTADKRGMTVDITGMGSDGPFAINYVAWPAAFCKDITNNETKDSRCVATTGTFKLPSSAQNFVFTVDQTAPVAPAITMPSRITSESVHAVGISGNAEPGSDVILTLKSSGGSTTYLAGHGSPIVAGANGFWQTVEDLSGLADGALTVKARSIDAAGNETDTTLSPAPILAAHASTLTEKVSSSRITYGQITQVSGRLVDQSGVGISHATVLVRPRFGDGSFGAATSAVTDSNGRWGAIVAPAHNATWYASYAGSTSPMHDAVTVHSAQTLVRAAIRFTSPKSGSTVGSPVLLKGKVGPNKRGATVAIYRHTASGNKLLGKVTLSKYSTWSFKLTLPHGTFKLFAVIGNTTGNLGNRTGYLTITH